MKRAFRVLLVVVAVLTLAGGRAGAQTMGASPSLHGPGQPPAAAAVSSVPWLPVVAMIGGAYLGSVLARRYLGTSIWVTLLGSRLGSTLGLDAAAGLAAIGEAVGGGGGAAARSAPTVPSWTI
jgi:hypothetical protein